MKSFVPQLFVVFLFLFSVTEIVRAEESQPTRVLILVEGKGEAHGEPMGDGRHLATLLGHFKTTATILGVDQYVPGEMKQHDLVFYIGFHADNRVPQSFLSDVLTDDTPIVWLHTGFAEFSSTHNVSARFGFFVSHIDSVGGYERIESAGRSFTKEEPNINMIHIVDGSLVEILATAVSPRTGLHTPYVVRSGNLNYIADSPFSSISSTDRYLLFADMLHDMLHQPHEESHTAIIRIEDVNPMENPDKLRDIADILSGRGIPFLVGVTPFYVNPGEGLRISLSDRPEIVDALKYMVRNGGTIVMHGVTHQYKGVTAADYEFWDESTNGPIKEESAEAFARKIEMGLQEFMKNGLYPLAWETPHYTGSFLLYETVAQYFSTAIEQRLAIENFDYSQFFPYTIHRDLFGQRLYPENLGYVPLDGDRAKTRAYIRDLIAAAKTNLQVRDGFASAFFHAFVELDHLKALVDGIQGLGYTFMDLREQDNWVRMKDRVILSGSQEYSITLHDQYLSESYFGRDGEIFRKPVSEGRISGPVTRNVVLEQGQFYKAEPAEFKEPTRTFWQQVTLGAANIYDRLLSKTPSWQEARPVILWNHYARGAAYNNQASFAAALKSINLQLDTIFVGQPINLEPYNLVIAPFGFIDSMKQVDFDAVVKFVESGGSLITDTKNFLAEELGFGFSSTLLNVSRPLDRYFPEERIVWRYPEPVVKFETDDVDEVFCVDNATEAPLVVGKRYGKGKVIFFGTRFDPHSQLGYSHYPFMIEYIRRYFNLGPIIRKDHVEMYFDPGFRHTQSIEDLVKLWVNQGIRRIHVAGWHQYPKYTYDYERLIRLAHANGILVFAWLEPPQVSQKFWLAHPEWREKNHLGEDVRPSWRYPVAMTDSLCREAMLQEYAALLEQHDWDGVNLAELYFEAGRGFDEPNLFTPMHPSAQQEVKRLYNVDLKALLDPQSKSYWRTNSTAKDAVINYRVSAITRVYRLLLDRFTALSRTKPGFQIVVTAMDSYGSPELREFIADDISTVLALQKQYGFHLNVEDPESNWSTDPRRYLEIGRNFTRLMGESDKLLLDLNILSFRKADEVTSFPTMIPTGTEAFLLVHSASIGAPRTAIYAESSVNPQDMRFLGYASATGIDYRHTGDGYIVTSPVSFTLRLPADIREISLNDMHLTPVRDNIMIIPAGEHTIVLSPDAAHELSGHQIEPRIMSFSGNVLSVSYGARRIEFTYDADGRALVSIDREPVRVVLDGEEYEFTPMKGNDCYSMFLPAGRHTVDIVAGDVFVYGVNLMSFWSSTGIALFGSTAIVLLLGMYLFWASMRRRISAQTKVSHHHDAA